VFGDRGKVKRRAVSLRTVNGLELPGELSLEMCFVGAVPGTACLRPERKHRAPLRPERRRKLSCGGMGLERFC